MSSKPEEAPSRVGDRGQIIRAWLDVIAKTLLAAAGLVIALLANTYQQKASVMALLSQRETAESELRASMMNQLVAPFVRSVQEDQTLEVEKARVLLEILALNFHANFELKPLFLEVADELAKVTDDHERSRGIDHLESVARRIVDRQIMMLQQAGRSEAQSFWERVFGKAASPAKQHDVLFELVTGNVNWGEMSNAIPIEEVSSEEPARFAGGAGQAVCSVSPDGRWGLRFRVTSYDAASRTAKVTWDVSDSKTACKPAPDPATKDPVWQNGSEFTVSPYDFPLTDNAQLDASHRFAINLFDINDDEEPLLLHLKLVWFPEGYITERERPMNFYEMKEILDLE